MMSFAKKMLTSRSAFEVTFLGALIVMATVAIVPMWHRYTNVDSLGRPLNSVEIACDGCHRYIISQEGFPAVCPACGHRNQPGARVRALRADSPEVLAALRDREESR